MTFDLLDLYLAAMIGMMGTFTYLFIAWRKWREAGISTFLLISDMLFFAYRHLI